MPILASWLALRRPARLLPCFTTMLRVPGVQLRGNVSTYWQNILQPRIHCENYLAKLSSALFVSASDAIARFDFVRGYVHAVLRGFSDSSYDQWWRRACECRDAPRLAWIYLAGKAAILGSGVTQLQHRGVALLTVASRSIRMQYRGAILATGMSSAAVNPCQSPRSSARVACNACAYNIHSSNASYAINPSYHRHYAVVTALP